MKVMQSIVVLMTMCLSAGTSLADDEVQDSAPASFDAPVWTTGTAMTAQGGRWEFGIFHPLHWGVTEDVELSTHPILTTLMPHLDAKVSWYAQGGLYIATRHGLMYPSLLLNLLSKKGALGLLPVNTEVPEGLIIDSDALVTMALAPSHWVTVEAGLSVAPRGGGDMPVVDFPYMYARFGVLSAPIVLHGGLGFEGSLWGQLGYTADIDAWWIPATDGGYALEHGLSLTWHISEHVGIAAGYRLSHARYPAGEQLHILPYADVLFGL
ncbi:MAG: hypothetical protein ACPGU1_20015 [Myxococcota bacterium]